MSNSVLEQFTQWPYPEPDRLKAGLFSGVRRDYELTSEFSILWPERAFDPHIDILVAGCGTNEAAVVAYDNPGARVVGIDISDESLGHARRLKAEHGLSNLTLHSMDIEAAESLGTPFDLIISSGVLHHLPRPEIAMAVLGRTLKPGGALLASMYRRHPRLGVYMIQDAVKHLGLGFSRDDVVAVRSILAALPDGHHLFSNTPRDVILSGSDTDVVDTFLNRHDVAYSVPELLSLIDASGLAYQCWLDNLDYYPDAYVASDTPLATRLSELPLIEQWSIVELLFQVPGRHRFVLRRTLDEATSVATLIGSDRFWDLTPSLRRGCRLAYDRRRNPELHREWHRLELTETDLEILRRMDGNTSNCEIGGWEIRALLSKLWRLGHIILSL